MAEACPPLSCSHNLHHVHPTPSVVTRWQCSGALCEGFFFLALFLMVSFFEGTAFPEGSLIVGVAPREEITV